jgi:hypothetical protein
MFNAIKINLNNCKDFAYLGKYDKHLKDMLVAIEIAEIDLID